MCVIFLFRHFASLAYVYYKMPKKKKNKKVPQTEQEEIIDAAESEALTHSLIPPSDTNLTTFLNHENDASIIVDENVDNNVPEHDDFIQFSIIIKIYVPVY